MMSEIITQDSNNLKEHAFIFNSWKYDFWKNPLIAFIDCLLPNIQRFDDKVKKRGIKLLRDMKDAAVDILSECAETYFLVPGLSKALIRLNKETSTSANNENIVLRDSKPLSERIESFQEQLSEYIKESRISRLYVFIDELDRCKPDFSISFLEIIKHLFYDVKSVTYILSFDKSYLKAAVHHIYGERIDAGSYIRRFFDVAFKLPEPESKRSFCDSLCRDARYRDLVVVVDKIAIVAEIFSFTLRDIEKFVASLKSAKSLNKRILTTPAYWEAYDLVHGTKIDLWFAYLFFLGLKMKFPKKYDEFVDLKSYKWYMDKEEPTSQRYQRLFDFLAELDNRYDWKSIVFFIKSSNQHEHDDRIKALKEIFEIKITRYKKFPFLIRYLVYSIDQIEIL